MTTKDVVLQVLQSLPDDATIEDVIESLHFVHTLQRRLDALATAERLTQQEVRLRLARWLQ